MRRWHGETAEEACVRDDEARVRSGIDMLDVAAFTTTMMCAARSAGEVRKHASTIARLRDERRAAWSGMLGGAEPGGRALLH